MANYRIQQKRIMSLVLPQGYDKDQILIGIPANNDELNKVGLKNVGDVVLPSADFGPVSRRNANGSFFIDKKQPKKNRYVSSIWIQPFGNEFANSIVVDIYKDCYPKIFIPPLEIELVLSENNNKEGYIIANLTPFLREKHLKEVVNLFLEIFGYCIIYNEKLEIENSILKRHHCNWVILPPGEKPSQHLIKQLQNRNEKATTFEKFRLEFIEKYNYESFYDGINGFKGYYIYIFSHHCVLECAKYGNATYFIPKENWEQLSQKTKQQLTDENKVISKLIHNAKWSENFKQVMKTLENQTI